MSAEIENKTPKTTARKEIKKTAPAEAPHAKAAESVQEVKQPAKISPKDIDLHQIVTVRNGFQGKLVYTSKKTGERFVWDAFGDEQDMELGELRSARSSGKKFFMNNWFMFDEPWVVDFLGMGQYYRYAVKIEDFDNLFTMSPEELEGALKTLSSGQKQSVAYRARQLIQSGGIDSNRVISTIERCLGVSLVDHGE